MSYKVKIICLQFSFLCLYLLFCRPVFSQADFGAIDQLFKQNEKALNNNFVALVWKDGKVLYQKQGSSTDFTPKTYAPIAEAGNWMTAALVMTFVDEGKISLDDKVATYIPLFSKYSKGYITLRNCLTNTTGIQANGKTKFETLEDEVNSYATSRSIVTNPGTEFYYSTVGINIAARVLEVITKKGFDRLMMERILRPCKMKGTSFTNEEGGATNPAEGARSTANDYINFLTMLLNNGTFEGKKVLSEKAIEELMTAQLADLPVKSMPKPLLGDHFTLGAYVLESAAPGGKPSTMLCTNLMGTTAWIDKCRNYAAVIIVLKPEEEKKPLFLSMKNLLDEAIGGGCK